ncbi:MAG TPA: hypothetical protein VMW08_00755 [Acidimicrobiales bacterium]|nr:hypothetical protein [Acidimicrobiales bacterium]
MKAAKWTVAMVAFAFLAAGALILAMTAALVVGGVLATKAVLAHLEARPSATLPPPPPPTPSPDQRPLAALPAGEPDE